MVMVDSRQIDLNPAEDSQKVWNEDLNLDAEMPRRATQLEVARQVAQKIVSIK
jgi:hypothetical protein